jgi:hypothetical protein
LVSYEESRRILGVSADATTASIRQAYLDLARVWHPDRFQSDERLRKIAGEHLREINEAYAVMKNHRGGERGTDSRWAQDSDGFRPATSGETAAAAGNPPPAQPDLGQPSPWTYWSPQPSVRRPAYLALLSRHISNKVAYTAMITVVCALPFLAVSRLVSLVRVPSLDTNLLSSQAFQPKILSPMRVIDPNSNVLEAADALTTWAQGDAIDLWASVGRSSPVSAAAVTPAVDGIPKKPVDARRKDDRKRPVALIAYQAPPPNGTDLIPDGRQSGAGELRLSNRTGLAAVFKLVSDRRTRRAVYVAPNGKVTLRSIPMGVYDLQVDLGKDLDVEHLHFLSGSITPAPLGPFEFLQVTSETGTSGNHYNVVLNPQ